jgi:hypothetical protein
MSRPTQPTRLILAALCAWSLVAGGGEVSKSEFFAQSKDYADAYQAAATELQDLILAERIGVVAVAEFTDLTFGELHVGRLFAEEFSTLLVAPSSKPQPKKGGIGGLFGGGPSKYRVMDPAAIEEFVRAGGGASLWSSTKKIREFGSEADVQVVVTGKIEISNREARFFLKAVATKDASILWARTLSVPGIARGTETVAAPLAAAAPVLEAQPLAAEPVVPVADKPTDAAPGPSAAAPAVAAAAGMIAAASPSPSVAPQSAAPAPKPVAPPSAAATAPVIPLGAAGLPAEVMTFDNGWLRARIRSASKYEGSGWVTAVLDVTNLSDRPVFVDVAQDDPGRGVDEFGNTWRVERVSGLRLAPNANPGMTPLTAQSTLSVVVVMATSSQPSGKRLSFSPNLLWWGSNGAGDSGRIALAFANVRVD